MEYFLDSVKLNAFFVSPFVGWKENSGEDTEEYIKMEVSL